MENNQSSLDKVYFYKPPQKMQLVILDLVKGSKYTSNFIIYILLTKSLLPQQKIKRVFNCGPFCCSFVFFVSSPC